MADVASSLARDYAGAFKRYLEKGDEQGLNDAYELGRRALAEGFRLLDLTSLHHQVLAALLAEVPRRPTPDWMEPAALFLAECLSSHEMSLGGYRQSADRLASVDVALAQAKSETNVAHSALLTETADRERAEEMLRHSQRLQAVGQLASGIAHHFNNILTIVTCYIDMARRRASDSAQVESHLRKAAQGVERGAAVTRQLLAFSRRQALRPAPLDPVSRLPATVELIRGALSGAITISTEFSADLRPILINSAELDLALINICLNAQDAMKSEGALKFSAANRMVHDASLGMDGEYLVLAISDSGPGIPPEDLSRVFEPFFTTKGPLGTGLGLSQVYGFAQQSGGAVEVASKAGKGATITLFLPVLAMRRSVLVVDDEVDVAEAAAAVLRDCGFAVKLTTRGLSALEALRDDEDIDLLFADIVMPDGMDGLALAAEARRLRPRLLVLLTTGFSEAAADRRGPLDFPVLFKPYNGVELKQAVLSMFAPAEPARP